LLVNGISSSKQKEFTCQWNVKVIEEAIYDLPMDNIQGHRKTVCLSMEFQVQSKKSLLANGITNAIKFKSSSLMSVASKLICPMTLKFHW
jgi:hypothetical protein